MYISKVKLYSSSYWSNKEVYRLKLGYKWHGMHKSRPESNLLDSINIKRHYSPYKGVPALLSIVKDW
jgi:hypothetical protein